MGHIILQPKTKHLYYHQFLLFLIFVLVTDTQPLHPDIFTTIREPQYFNSSGERPEFNTRNSEPVAGAAAGRPSNGAVAGDLKRCALVHGCLSNTDPYLLLFYPEIERTLRRARQVRRRIEFENNLRSQTENLASMNNSSYSSDSDSDCDILSSSDTCTSNMGDLPWITLKQMGRASMALEN
ncbi:hypothetical protein PIB30_075937 [Stylosanthes scabra]|uniref:Uncharacterized protein n=1 Tax=Stylosanthes scabra TaxID=79078 RepID=A0ABU6XRY4_9FABA|nr:hypothetical protein [Stylosanthes scabra]